MSKLTFKERVQLAFQKKRLPKLFFIMYIEHDNGISVLPISGVKIGDYYVIRDRNMSISWKLPPPPYEVIMPSEDKKYGGVVHIYVPDREMFIYLKTVKPKAKGKGYVFEAMIDGKVKKIQIDKPLFITPELRTKMGMEEVAFEVLSRHIHVREWERTKKQAEALKGFLDRWAPTIASIITIVMLIVIAYAMMNLYVNTLDHVAKSLAKAFQPFAEVMKNQTASNAAGSASGAW